MLLALFFFSGLVVLALWWLRWRTAAAVLASVALAAGLAIGCGPLAGLMVQALQAGFHTHVEGAPGDIWGRRAAIVLLGGGLTKNGSGAPETSALVYGRLVKALELYATCKRQGGDCYILASGGDPHKNGASEAAVYGGELRRLGVPDADLVLEEKSFNTWQNAAFCAPILEARPAEHVYLVTSGIHLRRALMYFQHFGVHATPVRADYVSAQWSPVPLAYNFLVADMALHEHAGLLQYRLAQQLGLKLEHKGAGAL